MDENRRVEIYTSIHRFLHTPIGILPGDINLVHHEVFPLKYVDVHHLAWNKRQPGLGLPYDVTYFILIYLPASNSN